jgi:hypothetical protein
MNGESLLLSPASTIQSKGLRLTFCVLPLKTSDVSGERLAQDRTNPARAIAQRDVGSNAF